jgi:hypothetical protein
MGPSEGGEREFFMMRYSRLWKLGIFFSLLCAIGAVARGQDQQQTMNASLPYGAVFPPETWLPLQLEFINRGGSDIAGWGVWPVEAKQGSVNFEVPVTVPAHSRVKVWAYGYVPAQAPGGKEWGQVKSGVPLATIQWRDQGGARLARVPVLGMASWASGKEATGDTAHPGWVFLSINANNPNPAPGSEDAAEPIHTPTEAENNATSLQDLCTQLTALLNEPILSASVPSQWAPRSDAGYAACRFVMLGEGNPDNLDAVQRQALLRFVRAGGNLVVASPRVEDRVGQSWIAPYLPVQLIGYRLADRIEVSKGNAPLKLLGYVPVAEAVVGSGMREHVVMRDAHYVHAAWRPLGAGRIIFTSFPVAGLDAKDKRTATIWRQLLNTEVPATHWQATQLHNQRVELVAGQLGKPTASWLAAAILAGGFVLLVLVAQLAFTGARRPGAFALAVGVAVVLSVVLVGWTMVRTGRQALMGSSLSVMEIGPDGGGHQREVSAYVGKNMDDFSISAKESGGGVLIRPIISAAQNVPVVREKPFHIPAAQVQALRVERVWQADGSAPADLKASATARFGETGLTLNIDNQTGQTLLSPVWLWDNAIFSLSDLPDGKTETVPDRRNAVGDYTNAAVIRSQLAQWRGQVVGALHTPLEGGAMGRKKSIGPEIDAWLAHPPALTDSAAAMRQQGMVSLPVRFERSPAGSTVKVDPAYVRLVTGGSGVAQYDPSTGRWLATNLDTTFLVGFLPPPQIGRLEPLEVNLDFDINAPQQTLTIRRGQTRNGKLVRNGVNGGEVVGEWTHPVERHKVTFKTEPSDYDAQGRVWLQVEVKSPPNAAAGGNVVSQWQFRYLEAGMTGRVK